MDDDVFLSCTLVSVRVGIGSVHVLHCFGYGEVGDARKISP